MKARALDVVFAVQSNALFGRTHTWDLMENVFLVPESGHVVADADRSVLYSTGVVTNGQMKIIDPAFVHFRFSYVRSGNYPIVLEWHDPDDPPPPCPQGTPWRDVMGTFSVTN